MTYGLDNIVVRSLSLASKLFLEKGPLDTHKDRCFVMHKSGSWADDAATFSLSLFSPLKMGSRTRGKYGESREEWLKPFRSVYRGGECVWIVVIVVISLHPILPPPHNEHHRRESQRGGWNECHTYPVMEKKLRFQHCIRRHHHRNCVLVRRFGSG